MDVPVRRGSRHAEPTSRRETDPLPVLPVGGVQEGNVDDSSLPAPLSDDELDRQVVNSRHL